MSSERSASSSPSSPLFAALPGPQTSTFAYVGVNEAPLAFDIVGECPDGYVLESRLDGRQLHVVLRAEAPNPQGLTSLYFNFRFAVDVVIGRDITVASDGRIFGSIFKIQ